jgi:hypothetical protein
MSMAANQWQFENVVETAELLKKLKEVREILKVLADNTFDTINVPTSTLIETHEHLVDARKSVDAAAESLCKS